MTFNPAEVRAYYSTRVPALRITAQKEWRGPCPVHNGEDSNFAVNAETGLAQCHSQCGRGWDLISLEQELSGLDFAHAKERVYEIVGRPKVPWHERNVQSIYEYTDEAGTPLYQVLRCHGKEFKQRRPRGDGDGWIWALGDVRRVPFRLSKVLATEFVAICEGEKDVLSLEAIGFVATCNSGGAGNFRSELARYFAGKLVAVFFDNDQKGRDHAVKVAALLAPIAKSVKIVELPGLPAKGDVTDFINSGGTREDLLALHRKAAVWTLEWQFAVNIPDENDRYVRTIEQEIEAAGGLEKFWDLTAFSGLPTPFDKLDSALSGGLRNGEVYVIGANQGAGKTSLLLQFAMAPLRKGSGVLIFSMEMCWRDVFQRMAGIEAHVDLKLFREAQLQKRESRDERIRLTNATAEINGWRLLVSTKPSVTPEYLIAEAKRLAKRSPIDLVICDHMQLMGADSETRSDYEKFTAISRSMKQVAVEMNVPLLLASQTSRANSREHRPDLEVFDLRGSGAIEEDCAGVFLLFEDAADAKAKKLIDGGRAYTKGPVKSFLKIGKNRYGEQGGCIPLLHYKGQTRFGVAGAEEPDIVDRDSAGPDRT